MKTESSNSICDKNLINDLITEIKDLKSLLLEKQELNVSPRWIPWRRVKQFFDYGDTQMAEMESVHSLVVAKVGRRKFVLKESIEELLDKASNRNIQD